MSRTITDWIGRTEEATDTLSPRLVAGLRATLDLDDVDDRVAPVPQTGHFLLAPPIAPMRDLGRDGHPALGGFLPPVPLPRRMWAASAMTFHRPLHTGDAVTRRSTIRAVEEKSGRTGALVFVTVDHVYTVDGVLAVEDTHTIVYREDGAPPRAPEPVGADVLGWPMRREIVPTTTMLFRYSALTFNGHRIHYDDAYAREVEGYPGLVVHGPLVATLLADLVARAHGPEPLAGFEFRAQSPAIVGRPLTLHGTIEGGTAKLRAVGEDGRVIMAATGRLARAPAGDAAGQ
jgi:3-methylfumaryl-CoA hydratase